MVDKVALDATQRSFTSFGHWQPLTMKRQELLDDRIIELPSSLLLLLFVFKIERWIGSHEPERGSTVEVLIPLGNSLCSVLLQSLLTSGLQSGHSLLIGSSCPGSLFLGGGELRDTLLTCVLE